MHKVPSAFHNFLLLVLICPILVVALLILLGHRAVNRDPCIYSQVGARMCMENEFIKSRTGGSPITCVVSSNK